MEQVGLLEGAEAQDLRSRDNDLRVDEFLVKSRILALLVGRGDQGVALLLEPFADAEFVLGGSQQARLLPGVVMTLIDSQLLAVGGGKGPMLEATHVVEDEEDFDLSISGNS